MRRNLIAFTLVVAVVLLSACTEDVSRGAPDRDTETTPGDEADAGAANEAPDFSFETFEGETFSLAEHRGTPVVLNFWESW